MIIMVPFMRNWTDVLACPHCIIALIWEQGWLTCPACHTRFPIVEDIPIFARPPFNRREYLFETRRYNRVALEKPDEWGLDGTYPEKRAELQKACIEEYSPLDVSTYLTIGPGFGQLEKLMPEKEKFCLDQSFGFLRALQKENLPNIWFVKGFAEKMPFRSNLFPCVVSDSVFQTMTEQREFLIECARVLKKDGLFLMATTYKWNYPRKPQLFPVDDSELLRKFLHELGIKADIIYLSLEDDVETTYGKGDYLFVSGRKTHSIGWEP